MRARHRVEITPRAERELASLPPPDRARVDARIRSLSDNPRPPGAQKLAGGDDLYRVRAGDYRVIYQIGDAELVVLVVRIGNRREVYRRLRRGR